MLPLLSGVKKQPKDRMKLRRELVTNQPPEAMLRYKIPVHVKLRSCHAKEPRHVGCASGRANDQALHINGCAPLGELRADESDSQFAPRFDHLIELITIHCAAS